MARHTNLSKEKMWHNTLSEINLFLSGFRPKVLSETSEMSKKKIDFAGFWHKNRTFCRIPTWNLYPFWIFYVFLKPNSKKSKNGKEITIWNTNRAFALVPLLKIWKICHTGIRIARVHAFSVNCYYLWCDGPSRAFGDIRNAFHAFSLLHGKRVKAQAIGRQWKNRETSTLGTSSVSNWRLTNAAQAGWHARLAARAIIFTRCSASLR